VSGLDPRSHAAQLFEQGATKREKYIYDLNHLEPPFPYKVLGLNPGTFGLDGLQEQLLPTERRVKV
jgi:hypothetical protein